MTHRENIREIADTAADDIEGGEAEYSNTVIIQLAILSAIEAVLGAEPSKNVMSAAHLELSELYRNDGGWIGSIAAREQAMLTWRAMSAELIKELKC